MTVWLSGSTGYVLPKTLNQLDEDCMYLNADKQVKFEYFHPFEQLVYTI